MRKVNRSNSSSSKAKGAFQAASKACLMLMLTNGKWAIYFTDRVL